jgi:hypothetical protein
MKLGALIPAAALTVCAFCAAAGAMTTVPYSGTAKLPPGLNGSAPNPFAGDGVNNPYGSESPFAPPRSIGRYSGQDRSGQGFLNADPFDPNSVVNRYDRNRYANPYPYDPVYNPYGQGPSRYSPTGPNVPMGQGMPYGR